MDLQEFLASVSSRSAPSVDSIIQAYIDNTNETRSVSISSVNRLLVCFQLNQTNLLDFFEKMRFYFVNGREQTRQRATQLVLELLSR